MSERCEHGVWMGDLCFTCEREKTADDVARLRRQDDEAVECCIIKDNRNLRLEAELTALKRAAWDVHDTVSAMLDNNEAEDSKAIRKVLDELGELIPAKRPATAHAPGSYPEWKCVHCGWGNTIDSDCFACRRPRPADEMKS